MISRLKYLSLSPVHSAKGGIAITQGPKISFFAPQGQLDALILTKFGTPPCPIWPKSVHGWGISPQN